MIIEKTVRDIQRSSNFQERSMGLAVGSEAFVFNVLRKDLYSNPIGSLIREYTVNAQDEHRKHGKTQTPIHIKVPNQFEPELRIRDFAGGLTEEQVFEFFGKYGASDKRDSNVAVGFFGLGCKSAFAYTDSYIVKSFKDGIAQTFNIYIDETEIGRVAKIAEEKTSEQNGVLIIVPVQSKDVLDFQKKVIQTVSYFKVKPTIEGLNYTPEFVTKEAIIKGEGWNFYGQGSPVLIMGEIAYPFSYSDFPISLESWETDLLTSDLELISKIGEVQVTASREALQMSPKTVSAIRARLTEIKAQMVKETEKAFESAKTIIEAKTLYHSILMGGSGYGSIIRQSGLPIKWNGNKLADNVIRFGEGSPHYVTTYTKRWGGTIYYSQNYSLLCSSDLNLFYDDTNGVKVNYKRRARTLLDAGAKSVSILHTSNPALLAKDFGITAKQLPSYNAIEPKMPNKVTRIGTGIDKAKRAKHSAKLFTLKQGTLKTERNSIASTFWEIKEVDTKKAVYIPIDRFHPILKRIKSLTELKSLLLAFDTLGIDVSDVKFCGVKNGQDTGEMIHFDKWLADKLDSMPDLKYEFSLANSYKMNNFLDVSYFRNGFVKKGLALDYFELYKTAKGFSWNTRRDSVTTVFGYSTLEVEQVNTLFDLHAKFDAKYPMIRLVESRLRGEDKVMDYIEERDNLLD